MNRYIIIFFLLLFLIKNSLVAQLIELPLANENFKPIWEVRSKTLEKDLQTLVASNKQWKKLANQKKLCIGVVDISDPDHPKYGAINENHMMYAASLPKIAILLAVMDAIEKGEVKKTAELEELMHKMIRVSNNKASTALIDLVGYDKIASVLQDEKYQLYNKKRNGGLWVGKRYAAGGKRNPDPILGLSHAATVSQVCRFYYLLAYGKLINCDRSEEMLQYLVDPHLHHKFVYTLDRLVPEAEIYRKSGTWKQFHADSVMVIGDEWRSYIVVALIESSEGEKIMRELLKKVDQALFNLNN